MAAVPPLMVRRDDNPDGVPVQVFDDLRSGSLADRSQLYKDLADGPFFNHPTQPVSQGVRDAFWLQSMAAGHRNAHESIAAFSATDFRADLARFDVPTLVIHGDADQVVPFEVGGKASAALVQGRRAAGLPGRASRSDRHPQADPRRGPVRLPGEVRQMSTIVLIHGLWVTPRSWEHWVTYYEAQGHTVLAPAYPGFDVEVEALRADTSPIASLTVPETVAHLEKVITALPEKPILVGHSFGGVLTQLLLDRGHGAAGVVIDSAPPEGIRVNPPSQLRSSSPSSTTRPSATGRRASRAVPLRLHQHPPRGRGQGRLRPVRHRGAGKLGVDVRADRQPHPGRRETWVDSQPRPGPAALHRRRARPHHAALGEQVQPPPLQGAGNPSPTTTRFERSHWDVRSQAGKKSPTTRSSGHCATQKA